MGLAKELTWSQSPRTQTKGGPSPSSRGRSSGITHFVSSLSSADGIRWDSRIRTRAVGWSGYTCERGRTNVTCSAVDWTSALSSTELQVTAPPAQSLQHIEPMITLRVAKLKDLTTLAQYHRRLSTHSPGTRSSRGARASVVVMVGLPAAAVRQSGSRHRRSFRTAQKLLLRGRGRRA